MYLSKGKNHRAYLELTAFSVAALAVVATASPAPAEVSFKEKTVQMGIGSDPGGGTDLAGRLVAQFITQYLPGKPTFTIKNFGSGGGKIRAANYLANNAPKDGTFVLQTDNTPLQPHVRKRATARFNPRDFRPIGAVNRGGGVYVVRREAAPRLKDKNSDPVIVGATIGTRGWVIGLTMAKDYLGWNLKFVPGYKGTSSMIRALRQGEIDMLATNNAYMLNELQKEGVVDLVAQDGQAEDNGYAPRETFPDVPLFPVALAKANPPKIALQAYTAVQGPGTIDKWATLPPGTPDEIVQVYREAYGKVLKDPKFLKIAKKELSPEIYYLSGAAVEKLVRELTSIPDEATDFVGKIRAKHGLSGGK